MNLTKMMNGKSLFALLLVLLFASACTSSSDEGMAMDDMAHTDEMEHDDSMAHDRVPNVDGAAVRIVSPADGATFKVGDEVTVEVELENFVLNSGNHWHIYVDGTSWGMVVGENMDDTLRGLEAGEHEISVYLSIETHEELEDGDAITIVVEE